MRTAAKAIMALAVAFCLATPSRAYAQQQNAPAHGPVRLPWRYEPTIAETIHEAMRFFRLETSRVDDMRTNMHLRALMPIITVNYRFDNLAYTSFLNQELMPLRSWNNWNQINQAGSAGLTWDLREAVFNPAEVQLFGAVSIQRDIILEITRTYFARKQLLIRMALSPPMEIVARDTLLLRIEEFTALIDVLTGGWFSTTARQRIQRLRR